MANGEEEILSGMKFYQALIIGLIIETSLLSYIFSGLAYGFTFTNTWIGNHIDLLAFIYLLALTVIPAYPRAKSKMKQVSRQITFSSAILFLGTMILWLRSFMVTDPSLIQQVIFDVAGWTWKVTGIVAFIGLLKTAVGEDEDGLF